MPFNTLKTHQFKVRLFSAIAVSLGCILFGSAIILWQTVSNTQQETWTQLRNAQQRIDSSLDNAHQVALAVRESLGKPCNDIVPLLRTQVAISPDVRSILLAHGNNIYCSSLYGPYQERINIDNYTKGQLFLMKGNWVKVDQPIVIYRDVVGNDSITVRIYGYLLLSELNNLSTNTPLSLVVGKQRWQAGKTPTDQLFPLETPGYMEQPSTRYPFRIVTRLYPADYIDNIWRFSKFSLIAWALLGLVSGIWAFRKSGRMHSPEQELRGALDHQEFIPYIQPVVSGDHTQLTGCEVLMRWQHPRQGMISPDRFIPMAEHSGLIIPMTRNLITQVREQFAPCVQQLPRNFHFGFNICAAHFRDFSLVEDCCEFIASFRENPIKLVLELTERELLVVDDVTHRLIAELHKLGVLIAIDDFGTGNSSLSYLQNLRIDILKIDKSFVSMIGTDAIPAHLVDNVIDLATRLDLKLVAEGVENEEQSAYLRARKVTYLQGYLYGRPMPVKEFLSLVSP
ncbi:cyclic diguanylate phosphodiesterase [Leclercia sp. AS011]|uniref:cyclic diguanylate phosphodiesterase n=1 Tax=Leclercia sp. AS011 TaxID=3081257 RepID=UPI003016FDBC